MSKVKNLIICLFLAVIVNGFCSQTIFANEWQDWLNTQIITETRYIAGTDHVQAKLDANGKPIRDEKGNVVTEIVHRSGFEEMGSDMQAIGELPKNLPKAFGNVKDTVEDKLKLGERVLDGRLNFGQAMDTSEDIIKKRQTVMDTQKNKELTKEINNGIADKDAEKTKEMLSDADKILGGNGKVDLYDSKEISGEQMLGEHSADSKDNPAFITNEPGQKPEEKQVFINANPETGTDLTNGSEIMGTLAHEENHRAGRNEVQADLVGGIVEQAWTKENQYNGNTTGSQSPEAQQQTQEDWLARNGNSSTLINGTDAAAGVKDFEADATIKLGNKQIIIPLPGKDVTVNGNKVVKGAANLAVGAFNLYSDLDTAVMASGITDGITPGSILKGTKGLVVAGGAILSNAPKLGNAVDKAFDVGRVITKSEKVEEVVVAVEKGIVGKGGKTLTTPKVPDGAVNTAGKVDFYVKPNGDVIPATGYRAIVGEEAAKAAKNGNIMSPSSRGTYLTFDNIENKSSNEITDILQLRNKPSHVAKFDTLQIIDDTKIPMSNWGRGNVLEPITSSYPNLGTGGATQAITGTPIRNYILKEVK